jgi:xylose isomerase
MSEEVKQKVLDYFNSKAKVKTKFYMNDLRQVAPEGMTNREFKKVINEMIAEGTLMYYSTGSTTMIQLAEADVDSKIK